MEYEKRLEEFEADFRLKEQELEKEKLTREKHLIAEREKEIEDDRKRMLEQAFGTDDISLGDEGYGHEMDGLDDDSYGEVEDNYSDSYEFESSENADEVAEVNWELDLVPKKKSKSKLPAPHKRKEHRYTYPSERDYKPLKNHRHYRNDSDDDEDEDDHHHHHKSKHHHKKKKHHSHDSSEEKHRHDHHSHHDHDHHHKKDKHHHHHHNEIDPVLLEWEAEQVNEFDGEVPKYHTFDLDLKAPTVPVIAAPRVPARPERPHHPFYPEVVEDHHAFAHEGDHLRYAAEHFSFEDEYDIENIAKEKKRKKSKKSKKTAEVPLKIKEKVEKRQMETKPHWTAAHAHLATPLAPVDTHWRSEPAHIADIHQEKAHFQHYPQQLTEYE